MRDLTRKPKVRRLVAALLLALLVVPGTWLRTRVPDRYSTEVSVSALPFDGRQHGPLRVQGLWQLHGAGENFGGYSAMLILGREGLRLFSDRGFLLNVPRPGANPPSTLGFSTRQLFPTAIPLEEMRDIESVTISRETGQYWVGYENRHVIHRYSLTGEPETHVEPAYTRNWAENGGFEAIVLLRDGRFLAFHEGGADYFLYPGDPTEGVEPVRGMVQWPQGYSVTDAAELPDGRVLALVRRVVPHWPPFEAMLVLLGRPPADPGETWRARPLVSLDRLVARENWEALAVEEEADGRSSLWIASDDNRSALQRSLLAHLALTLPADPEATGDRQ